MRYSLLVAMREYAENVKTKGFVIGLLLFPLILVVSLKVPKFLEEKAKPTRHFVLVDQSGQFEEVIHEGLERHHARRVMGKFQEYVQRHKKVEQTGEDGKSKIELFENMPAVGMDELVNEFLNDNPEMLDQFAKKDGLEKALEGIKPQLKPDAPEFEEPRRLFVKVDLPSELDPTGKSQDLVPAIKPYLLGEKQLADDKEMFAFVFVPKHAMKHVKRPGMVPTELLDAAKGEANLGVPRRGIQYWSKNVADTALRNIIRNAATEEVRRNLYTKKGIDNEDVQEVQRTRAIVTTLDPAKEVGKEQVSMADTIRQWAPLVFVYMLFIALITVVQMLLNNTVEEKSNRIIEVLLSSVTPGELMNGKLIGIAGVGLTIVVSWVVSIMAVLHFMKGPETEIPQLILDLLQTSGMLTYFVVYFILGYLLYAGLFLVLGSVCNTLKEAQNLMGPVIMVMMVPLITMLFVREDPNGTLATVMSWIPPYTPFLMMNRAAADPPFFDLVGTGILLVASTALVLLMTGKIFRIAILRTGQPPKVMEMLRWLKRG